MRSSPNPYYRNEHARQAILAATVELASELGYEKTSIEGIAKQAGVSKQTIYRWWPSKGAVVLEALAERLSPIVTFTDTGDLVEDFRAELNAVARLFNSPDVGALYRGLLVASQSDPGLAETYHQQVLGPATEACRRRIEAARGQGQVRDDIDVDILINMLYGTVFRLVLLRTGELGAAQIDAALTIAFEGAGRSAATTGATATQGRP